MDFNIKKCGYAGNFVIIIFVNNFIVRLPYLIMSTIDYVFIFIGIVILAGPVHLKKIDGV